MMLTSTSSGVSSAGSCSAGLRGVIARLDASTCGPAERLALAEAYFRLAVQPGVQVEEAIDLLGKAERIDPYHPKLPFHLGRLRHLDGDFLGAVLEYRRALRLAPRSLRTFVHLALSLRRLSGPEQSLAAEILSVLAAGQGDALSGLVRKLDLTVEAWVKAAGPTAPPPTADTARVPGSPGRAWPGLWKVSLLTELSRPPASRKKPGEKRVTQWLEQGKALVEKGGGVAEYALACLCLLPDAPSSSRRVRAILREPAVASRCDREAVRLLTAACELGEAGTGDHFVALATAKIQAGELPLEVICALHDAWFARAADLDPLSAIELIDRYPDEIREAAPFRELRIAILDRHARDEFNERPDRAEILWRHAFGLDPNRVALAHNLALVATRAKSPEQYKLAWERAAELRYLLAAAAGDVRAEVDDRIGLHRSVAQQCQLRYSAPPGSQNARDQPQLLLASWMSDADALATWLREWELYYLNARLRFRSVVHFLGIARDCSDDDAEAARDRMGLQFELSCLRRGWAGSQVFVDLVRELADRACVEAKDPIARKRDAFHEIEKAEFEALAKEAVEHGIVLFNMLTTAATSDAAAVRLAGYSVGRALLVMPWRSLEPFCRRHISDEHDVVDVWVSQFLGVILQDLNQRGQPNAADAKIALLQDCLRVAPESGPLRVCACRLLLKTQKFAPAYEVAVESLALTERMPNRTEAADLLEQFLVCIDDAAFGQIPDRLRRPSTLDAAAALVAEGRRVLALFPRAWGLRQLICECLIEMGKVQPSRLTEAGALLEQGLAAVSSDEQLQELQRLLAKAGGRSETAAVVAKIRGLLESASGQAREAVATVRAERTPTTLRQAAEIVEAAIRACQEAEEAATAAALSDWADRARSLGAELKELINGFEKG